MKIVIVGGGTAGWMAASYYSKFVKDCKITVIESSKIPRIGVGESVTPHVAQFFKDLGFDTHEWMNATGAVYKLANKFGGWKENKNEYEYFSFNYPTDAKFLYKDINKPLSPLDLPHNSNSLTTDYFLSLYNNKEVDKFDKYFNSQYYYMEKNVAPFIDNECILNAPFGWTQHINADKTADFLRDRVAVPNGVRHVDAVVTEVRTDGDKIKSVVADNGEEFTADLFLDATGFKRLLTSALGWKEVPYKNAVADRAWVCQLDYDDPESEMVNYTQSTAKESGWMFKIGVYHRMGCGLVYGSKFLDDNKALDQYYEYTKNRRREPRLIKWNPCRLEKIGDSNLVAIGLSGGFVEPLEANALFVIINSIRRLYDVIAGYQETQNFDFKKFNEIMIYSIDDIADFISVHYTLSSRNDSDMWNEMRELGKKENHTDLVYEKYKHVNNTMQSALQGYTMFPQYMWAQWAIHMGIDTSKWYNLNKDDTYELAKLHFLDTEKRHSIISRSTKNNHQWLKENVFNNLTPLQWENSVLKNQ
jgi:tryptophan halogenase